MVPAKTVKGLLVFIILHLFVISPLWAAKAGTFQPQKVAQDKSPVVDFKNGLFSIMANKTPLGVILSDIEKQSGLSITINEEIKTRKVTVRFSNLDITKTLKAITNAAGLGGYGISYRPAVTPGKIGQWVTDNVTLVEKGDDAELSPEKPDSTAKKKSNRKAKEPALKQQVIEKEPYFDKRLNRYVEVVQGEVLVKFAKDVPDVQVKEFHKEKGTKLLKAYEKINAHRLKIPVSESVQGFIEKSLSDKYVYVEPIFLAQQQFVEVNDPSFPDQWAIPKIGADRAWEITNGSPDVIVAVIDTGIDILHPDLKNKVIPGINILDGSLTGMGNNGHGTFVAGIIAAEANNSVGITGISWQSRLMPVKVLTASGEGTYADLLEGIIYAVDHGARVLNLSLGGYSYSQFLADAIQYAHSNKAVIIAAGGNENIDAQIYPAAFPNVVGVSATDSSDQRWSSSNHGAYIKLSAPGVGVISTMKDNRYAEATGTSVSTAHVSGVAALVLAKNPAFSNTQIENILFQAADDLGDKGWDNYYGAGRVNALKAIEKASIEVHDVAVTNIRIEPETFKAGEATKIIVTVENQGTFAERDISLKVSVNDGMIDQGQILLILNSGEQTTVSFNWMPEINDVALIKAEFILAGDEDLTDNINLKKVYLNVDKGMVTIKYAVKTHRWITQKAIEFLNAKVNNSVYTELNINISQIKDGAEHEDCAWYDHLNPYYPLCFNNNIDKNGRYFRHFYRPVDEKGYFDDISSTQFENSYEWGFTHPENSYDWQDAIAKYKSGQTSEAYFALGHVLHLIEDASLPEHTHLEAHASVGSIIEQVGYEKYVADMTYSDTSANLPTPLQSDSIITYNTLREYFHNLAKRSYYRNRFQGNLPSNPVDGSLGSGYIAEMFPSLHYQSGLLTDNAWVIDTERVNTGLGADEVMWDPPYSVTDDWWETKQSPTPPNTMELDGFYYIEKSNYVIPVKDKGSFVEGSWDPNVINGGSDIYGVNYSGNTLAELMAYDLIPLAIRYVAGAAVLFYDETHPPTITTSISITPQTTPYYIGQTISAQFAITNKGATPITVAKLTVGGRDPDGLTADFPFQSCITLQPNVEYIYEGTLTLAKAGSYSFFPAYETPTRISQCPIPDGNWNTAIPAESGVTKYTLDSPLNITVITDTTKPSVSITYPATNSNISGTATVSASASDNIGVSRVEFYKDNTLQFTDSSSPYSWSWNTTDTSNGTHSLYVKACDAANNCGISSAITVNVNNASGNNPPNTPTALYQYKSDGVTGMAAGATTNERTIVMKGNVSDPDNDPVLLEIEIKPVGTAFSNSASNNCVSSGFVSSGGTAVITCSGLADGQYHWQARTKDSKSGLSGWFSAGGNSESSADFIVSASLLKIGDWVSVTGTGGIGLKVRACPSTDDIACPKKCTASDGNIGKIVNGPQTASGYTWWEISWNDGSGNCPNGSIGWSSQDWLSQIINFPPSVVVISPNGGEMLTAGSHYDIKWNATDNTGTIQKVEIYNSADGGVTWSSSPINSNTNNTGIYTWTPNVATTQGRIKVLATDSYGDKGSDISNGNFSVASSCTKPPAPTLQGITAYGSSYTASWSASSGATYNFQQDTSSSFNNPVTVYSGSGTSWYSGEMANGTYYYRVKAINSCGESDWSNIQSATIQVNQGPGPITALNPADNAINQLLSVTLSWSASHPNGESLRYNVYVCQCDTTNYFTNNIKSYSQTSTSFNLTNLPYNTTISWGIEAIDDTGDSRYSPMFHFSTLADSSPPTGSILINNGAASTISYAAALNLSATDSGSGVRYMRFSNDGVNWSYWTWYATQYQWNLADYNYGGKTGQTTYTVYAQFRDEQGNESVIYNDSITKTSGTPGNIILNGKYYETIRDAVNGSNSGDTIYLTEGTYTILGETNPAWEGGTRYTGILMKPGVTLKGAGAEKTVLQLDGTGLFTIIDADNVVIEGLTIINADPYGVKYAVLLASNSSKIRNCIIKGSYGGLQIGWSPSKPSSNSEISNNLIINNTEGIRGFYGTSVSIFNNTIAYNNYFGISTGSGVTPFLIKNNIIVFHSSGISTDGSLPEIQYNNVYGSTWWNYASPNNTIPDQTGINGNISVNPSFVNPSAGDYRLNAGSPVIDRGTNVGIPYNGSAPDMGAFEYNGTGTIQITSNRSDASFTIRGPSDFYTGSGTSWSQSNLPIGIYTITFTAIANLYSPPYQSMMLYSGQTLIFDGTYSPDNVPPTGTMSVNFDEYATADNLATITFDLSDEVAGLGAGSLMMFSNDGITWSPAEPYSSMKKDWDLTLYGGNATSEIKTVYATASDALGNWATLTDTVLYVPNRQILEVPTQYSTIQVAIDAAQDGDMVYLLPGTYQENITLKTGVRLQGSGADKTILQAPSSDQPIALANNSMIDGFRISWRGDVIATSNISGAIVSNNVFDRRVGLWDDMEIIIRNNIFNTYGLGSIIIGAANSTRVNVRIENNVITNTSKTYLSSPTVGVLLSNATPTTKVYIKNNIITANGTGIQDYNTSDLSHQHIFSSFNTFWNNTNNFADYAKAGPGDMTADPLFVNVANGDFHLKGGSSSIDSGYPEDRYNDPDGSRNDRGAYGGPTLNTPPVADFSLSSITGSTVTIFTFNAGLSHDGESKDEQLQVRWDFEGDGIYDTGFTTNKFTTHKYDTPGTFNITLQVKDDKGYLSTAIKLVNLVNQSPNVPHNPVPADGSTVSVISTLAWTDGDPDYLDTVTYDVYFGTDGNPPLISSGQTEAYFNLGTIASGSVYYWRIVATDNHGSTINSPVWYFVTSDDSDEDGYANQEEVADGSDPYNPESTPGDTSIHLYPGFNLVSIPAEMLFMDSAFKMLPFLGDGQEIEMVLHLNMANGKYEDASYLPGNILTGINFPNKNGEGQIIYSKVEKVVTFTSKVCPEWNLSIGLNLVGTPCALGGLTAFQLLEKIGSETVVSSIQKYNIGTGKFETAGYHNGQPVGVDFQIVTGEGYFIFMKQERSGFRP